MTMTLNLPPDLEAAVRALAERSGRDPDSYVVTMLEEHVRRHAEVPHLPREEAVLLQEINRGLPPSLWQRYHELVARRRAETLTATEQKELIALSDEIEIWNARRLELLVELSRLRGVPLDSLMKDLGLSVPQDA